MNYNEIRQLCKWLKMMGVKTGGQWDRLVRKFNLDTAEKQLNFANGCATHGLTYADLTFGEEDAL